MAGLSQSKAKVAVARQKALSCFKNDVEIVLFEGKFTFLLVL